MEINRGSNFLRLDFATIDSGILGCIPLPAVFLYMAIRRHVWRSMESGDPRWRTFFKEGKLAATITQCELGEYLGRDRRCINGNILILKRLGWIKVIKAADGMSPATYVIGERIQTGTGKLDESFFADVWMCEMWDTMFETAALEFGEGASINKLSWEKRREICERHIEKTHKRLNILGFPQKCNLDFEPEQDEDEDSEETEADPTSKKMLIGDQEGYEQKNAYPLSKKMLTGEGGMSKKMRIEIAKPLRGMNRELENREAAGGSPLLGAGDIYMPDSFAVPVLVPQGQGVNSGVVPVPSTLPVATPVLVPSTILVPVIAVPAEGKIVPRTVSYDTEKDVGEKKEDKPVPTLNQRLTAVMAVAKGDSVPEHSRTEETYAQKIQRERQRQADRGRAKESKLKNFDGSQPAEVRAAIKHLENIWSVESKARFGSLAGVWQPADRKQVETLLKSYPPLALANAIRYLVGRWPDLQKRFWKGAGSQIPTIAVLSKLHATIVPEGMDYTDVSVVITEWENWYKLNPQDDPPPDLLRRYRDAQQKLKTMGAT